MLQRKHECLSTGEMQSFAEPQSVAKPAKWGLCDPLIDPDFDETTYGLECQSVWGRKAFAGVA